MDLREHFSAMWRRRWPILIVSVLVAVAVYVAFDSEARVYQASAQLTVIPGQSQNGSGESQSDTTFLAAQYAQLGKTAPVVEDAIKTGKLGIDVRTATSRLSVSASATIGYITVSGKAPTKAAAVALTQAESEALSRAVTAQQTSSAASQISTLNQDIAATQAAIAAAPAGSAQAVELQSQLQAQEQLASNRQSQTLDQVNVVAPAQASPGPVAPKPTTYAVLGFVAAIVIDSELAALFASVSDRFRPNRLEEEINRAFGLPVLARVPKDETASVTEAFRKIRTSLLFLEGGDAEVRTIAVVGSEPSVGKSFCSENLARAMAESGPTVLIDGDLRHPVLHEQFGLPLTPGLSEALDDVDLRRTLHPVRRVPNLRLMPAGRGVRDPSAILADLLTSGIVEPLGRRPFSTRTLIVDTPAEGLFPDALTIAAQTDLTIVVIDAKSTRKRVVHQTLAELKRVGAKPAGIVVNRSATRDAEAARYYYDRPDPSSSPVTAAIERVSALLGRRPPLRRPPTRRPASSPAVSRDSADHLRPVPQRRTKTATPRPTDSRRAAEGWE